MYHSIVALSALAITERSTWSWDNITTIQWIFIGLLCLCAIAIAGTWVIKQFVLCIFVDRGTWVTNIVTLSITSVCICVSLFMAGADTTERHDVENSTIESSEITTYRVQVCQLEDSRCLP